MTSWTGTLLHFAFWTKSVQKVEAGLLWKISVGTLSLSPVTVSITLSAPSYDIILISGKMNSFSQMEERRDFWSTLKHLVPSYFVVEMLQRASLSLKQLRRVFAAQWLWIHITGMKRYSGAGELWGQSSSEVEALLHNWEREWKRAVERKLCIFFCLSLLACQIPNCGHLCAPFISLSDTGFTLKKYSLSPLALPSLSPHHNPFSLFSSSLTIHKNSPSTPSHPPSVLKPIFQHLWVVLAALVEEVVVVSAYFSCSKSSLL